MGQESGGRPKFGSDAHRSFNLAVGKAIRRSRLAHGWTQAVLASRAGLSPNYVARLERGELGPSLFVAHRICDALSIELDALVTSLVSNVPLSSKRSSVN